MTYHCASTANDKAISVMRKATGCSLRPSGRAPNGCGVSRRNVLRTGVYGAGLVLFTACGGETGGKNKESAVRIATSVTPDFIQVPLMVAEAAGYFTQGKLDHTLSRMAGNVMPSALLSGSVDYAYVAAGANVADMRRQGHDVVAFGCMTYQNPNIVAVSKSFLRKSGGSATMPVRQRLQKLRGARWAAIAPSSASSATVEYLMGMVGYKEGHDYTLTYINSVSGIVSAMRAGKIDAFLSNSPGPEQAEANGSGLIYLNPGAAKADLPAFQDMTWAVLWATSKELKAAPEHAAGVVHAIGRAQTLIHSDPDRAKGLIRKNFTTLSDEIFERAWENSRPLYPQDPRMTDAAFAKALSLHGGGTADDPASAAAYFTNTYVDAAEKSE